MDLEELLEQIQAADAHGDVDELIPLMRQFLSLGQQTGHGSLQIVALRGLGNCYQEKGNLQKAHSFRVEAAQQVEKLAEACPPSLQMLVEGDLGRSYCEVKNWSMAEAHTQTALRLAESLGEERERRLYQINLGWILANTDRVAEAKQLAEDVLQAAKALEDDYLLALQHLNLASLLLYNEHRLNECQRHARQTIVHAERAGKPALRVQAEVLLGAAYQQGSVFTGKREYAGDASERLHEAVDQAQTLGNPILEMGTELELAQLAEDRHQPEAVLRHYRRALELLETIRVGLGYEEFQLTFFESYQPVYARVTEFLLRQGQLDEAFRTAERLRSRLLLTLLGPGRSNTGSWQPAQQSQLAGILDQFGKATLEQCLGAGTRGRMRDMTVGGQPKDKAAAPERAALALARRDFLELYEAQRLHRVNWHTQQSPPVIGLDEARRLLGPDDALLSYFIAESGFVIFVATREAAHFQHLAYPGKRLDDDVTEVCRAMGELEDLVLEGADVTRQSWPEPVARVMDQLHRALEKLYALLVAPVLAVAAEKPHWVIVPHGHLHRLPWAALRGSGRYLVERHSLSLLPSVSLGAILQSRQTRPVGEAVFFANPDPDDAGLRLPGSQREVEAAYPMLRRGPRPFVGAAATKREFLQRAPAAWLLHLACHHLFDASAPLLSFLKLAGRRGSDFLYAFEIAELELSAELVALSACQSAHSRTATGDEQIGIVRSFLAAGVGSVISTLWSIEDESAAAFFTALYGAAFRLGLAQALAEAQRRLLVDPRYRLPYFWAPYVLTGRWDKPLMAPAAQPS